MISIDDLSVGDRFINTKGKTLKIVNIKRDDFDNGMAHAIYVRAQQLGEAFMDSYPFELSSIVNCVNSNKYAYLPIPVTQELYELY